MEIVPPAEKIIPEDLGVGGFQYFENPSKCHHPSQHFYFKYMSLVQRLLWILTEHSEFSPHVGRRKSEEETGHTPVLLSQLSPPRVYTEVAVMECSGPFVNCLVSGLGPREGPWSPLSAACRTDVPSHLSSLLDKLHSCKLGMWYNIWQSTLIHADGR